MGKNEFTIKFLKEWLRFGKDEKVIGSLKSKAPNFQEFIEHRWDQSILSNLVQKEKIKYLPLYSSEFLNVHRQRERSLKEAIIFKVKSITPISLKNKIKQIINR